MTLTRRESLLLVAGASIAPFGAARAAVPLSTRLSLRPQNGPFVDASSPNLTYGGLYELESQPLWVRLCYTNEMPTPWRVDGAAIAVTSAFHDGYTPVDAQGSPAPKLWQRVTFDASGGDSAPAAGGGKVFALDIGSRTTGPVPQLLFSDWVRVDRPPASNREGRCLLLVRTYATGLMRTAIGRHFGSGTIDPAIGRLQAGFWSPGDGTQAPWSFGPTRMDQFYPTYGLQYMTATPGATVIGIGDSILSSMHSAGGVSGPGYRASVLVSTSALPVSYVNQAFVGRKSADFLARGMADIEALRPQIAVIQAWTEADPWADASSDATCDAALALTDFAASRNCLSVLVGPAPVFATHPEAEPARQHSLVRLRRLAETGKPVLDVDAIWGSGAVPNAYQARYDLDHTHPNDAGCGAAARVLAVALRGLLGQA